MSFLVVLGGPLHDAGSQLVHVGLAVAVAHVLTLRPRSTRLSRHDVGQEKGHRENKYDRPDRPPEHSLRTPRHGCDQRYVHDLR